MAGGVVVIRQPERAVCPLRAFFLVFLPRFSPLHQR